MAGKKMVPAVRFAEFTDAWEQRKLGEIATEIKRNDPESTAPIMMISFSEPFWKKEKKNPSPNAGFWKMTALPLTTPAS